jgi:hypothetical protein
MRTLTILSLLQTAAILFLIWTIAGNRTDTGRPQSADGIGHPDPAGHDGPGPVRPLDDARLRRIIREELAGQANAVAGVGVLTASPAGKVRNPVEDQFRKERVARQMDYYRRIGAISPAQMQDLQREIAQLDEASRKAALGQLMRSLNSGQIDGRF